MASGCLGCLLRRKHAPASTFTEAWLDAGIAGSVGDVLDKAPMESTIGLFKTELIDRQRSWAGRNEVEKETAAWVHWFNIDRLHAAIDYRAPVEFENTRPLQWPEASVGQIQDGSKLRVTAG